MAEAFLGELEPKPTGVRPARLLTRCCPFLMLELRRTEEPRGESSLLRLRLEPARDGGPEPLRPKHNQMQEG